VCESWTLVVREELRLLDSTVLRKMVRSKGKNVTSGWRKISNEDLHDLHSSPNVNRILQQRRKGWVGHVGRMAKKGNGFGGEICKKKTSTKI
jgi:hypothetical protein